MKLGVFALALVACTTLTGQWLNFPAPGTPRSKDGKPNLSAPTPRALDGKPDLSGVWMHEYTTMAEMRRVFGKDRIDAEEATSVAGMEIGTRHKYGLNLLADLQTGPAILRPEAERLMRERGEAYDPSNPCAEIGGIPLMGLLSEGIKIVQAPKMTMVLYELDNMHRQIFTDGRSLPKEINLPAYLGYSVGHWERDVFVVETAGFNDRAMMDLAGTPHSESLHITERFHRRDFGHLDVEMTFTDPVMFTRPFTIRVPHNLMPEDDIFEMFCQENEKDRTHMKKP